MAQTKKALRECEDWRTAIEFVCTKFKYEQFVGKYGSVDLNLQANEPSKQPIETTPKPAKVGPPKKSGDVYRLA